MRAASLAAALTFALSQATPVYAQVTSQEVNAVAEALAERNEAVLVSVLGPYLLEETPSGKFSQISPAQVISDLKGCALTGKDFPSASRSDGWAHFACQAPARYSKRSCERAGYRFWVRRGAKGILAAFRFTTDVEVEKCPVDQRLVPLPPSSSSN